jgi:hypothetical protein
MTNNTIPNVPRELLAELQEHIDCHRDAVLWGKVCDLLSAPSPANHVEDVRAMVAAPSPAGVDGLKSIAWIDTVGRYKGQLFGTEVHGADPLCRLSAAKAIIDGLRGEVERLQMQLAACGVVALANTIESAGEARQMHPDYMSASCSDVADAVDREIALRTERDTMRQQLAVRDEEIERIRVQLMTIASAEPARHSIEWAKAVAATGNNEVYAKWREAFDERDQQAQRIGELERLLRDCYPGCGLTARQTQSIRERIDAALSAGK